MVDDDHVADVMVSHLQSGALDAFVARARNRAGRADFAYTHIRSPPAAAGRMSLRANKRAHYQHNANAPILPQP
jgi:hypothetical protein